MMSKWLCNWMLDAPFSSMFASFKGVLRVSKPTNNAFTHISTLCFMSLAISQIKSRFCSSLPGFRSSAPFRSMRRIEMAAIKAHCFMAHLNHCQWIKLTTIYLIVISNFQSLAGGFPPPHPSNWKYFIINMSNIWVYKFSDRFNYMLLKARENFQNPNNLLLQMSSDHWLSFN